MGHSVGSFAIRRLCGFKNSDLINFVLRPGLPRKTLPSLIRREPSRSGVGTQALPLEKENIFHYIQRKLWNQALGEQCLTFNEQTRLSVLPTRGTVVALPSR